MKTQFRLKNPLKCLISLAKFRACTTSRSSIVLELKSTFTEPDSEISSAMAPKVTEIASSPLAAVSHEELSRELTCLFQSVRDGADYLKVRDRRIALEFELNDRKVWAPAFRGGPEIPYAATKRTPTHTRILQDRILIDCHWLHRNLKKKQAVKELRWASLSNPQEPFPLELAQEFAERTITGKIRADEILCLSPFLQAQCKALAGAKISAARKSAETVTATGRSPLAMTIGAINQWAARDPRVNVEKYEALARSIALLDGTRSTNSELGALTGLMLSEPPIPENVIRAMRMRLDKVKALYA